VAIGRNHHLSRSARPAYNSNFNFRSYPFPRAALLPHRRPSRSRSRSSSGRWTCARFRSWKSKTSIEFTPAGDTGLPFGSARGRNSVRR
jgi:hypothetical protein